MRLPNFCLALLMALLFTICGNLVFADGWDPKKLSIVVLCNSRLRRCLPPEALPNPTQHSELADIMEHSAAKVYFVFTDVRSAEAAQEVTSKYPVLKSRSTLIPCDISDFGSSSLLSCIAATVARTLAPDDSVFFISGSASSVPPNVISQLYEVLAANHLSGVSCLSVMSGKSVLESRISSGVQSPVAGDNSNESVPDVVFSAGFGRAPIYRSSLGGTLISVVRNNVGMPADDARLRDFLQVDSIDFTASLVTAQAFVQSSLHPPLMFQRAMEWCPTWLDEMQWLVAHLSDEEVLRDQAEMDEVEKETNRQSNNNNNNNSDNKHIQQQPRKKIYRRSSDNDVYRKIERQVKRATMWLESLDSDSCNVRTRYGLRFDEMFVIPASPELLGGHVGIVGNSEKVESFGQQLLHRLSSALNDAVATAQIVRGMESVAQFGNSLAVVPNLQVRVDVDSASTGISFPSVAAYSYSGDASANGGTKFPLVVVWDQYCCHCCGFSSEIERFVLPLSVTVYLTSHISCFCTGQREHERLKLEEMYLTPERLAAHPATDVVIWISHTQPYLFAHPLQEVHSIDYHIARMMFEWSRINPAWVSDIKTGVNEVWVPGQWVQQVFVQSGVPASKIFVIPEAVDTHRFNPEAVKKFDDIDAAAKKLGWNMRCSVEREPGKKQGFVFFSNFKWEARKGWDTLLTAYENFGKKYPALARDVTLYILTFSFANKENPRDAGEIKMEIDNWYRDRVRKAKQQATREKSASNNDDDDDGVDVLTKFQRDQLQQQQARAQSTEAPYSEEEDWRRHMPRACFIVDVIPDDQMDMLYASADAFVMPTRGEGWGLPIIQSMSLGKPVLAPRWGGQLEFMNDDVSFFIEIDGLEEDGSGDAPSGTKWAIPSATHLTELMALVVNNPSVAANVGKRAREHVVTHFSDEAVRKIVEKRLRVIHDFVSSLYR